MRRGFTLVEMMLATVLAALLMAGVMTVASGLSRDRRRMEGRPADVRPTVVVDLIRRDLVNSSAIVRSERGDFVLIGHAGLDATTMTPTGRLAKVTYRLVGRGRSALLMREQRFLDDAIRPAPWAEVVLGGAGDFILAADSQEEGVSLGEEVAIRAGLAGARAVRVPARVRVRISHGGAKIDEQVVVR